MDRVRSALGGSPGAREGGAVGSGARADSSLFQRSTLHCGFEALTKVDVRAAASSTSDLISHGLVLGQIQRGKSAAKLTFNKSVPSGFVDFIAGQIESLHDQFMQKQSSKQGD